MQASGIGARGASRWPWLAAAAGGGLYVLAFVGFGIGPLVFFFVLPLWAALDALAARGTGRPAAAGLLFGAVAHVGGHLWLWRLVEIFLAGDALLGAALFALHGLWFAAGFGLYGAVFAVLRRLGAPLAVAGVAPWLVLEWGQVQIFPVHAGNALSDATPLVQIADLGGPLLLSAFVLGVALALYTAGRRFVSGAAGVHRPLLAAAGLVAAVLLYGWVRVAAVDAAVARAPALRVGLVQADLGVLDERGRARTVHAAHRALSETLLEAGPLDLLVWPETAELRAIRGPLPVSGRFVRDGLDVPLLFGGTLVQETGGMRSRANSALLVEEDGLVRQAYAKNLLIPLAEWVPLGGWLPGLAERLPHAQAFRAATDTPPLVLGDVRLATPICYEAVRPGFVRRMVAAARPHVLVTLANDAWFGDSQEPWIHLRLARLRAVEHRRFLVRATNSGISAFVDPAGRIVARTPLLARATLRGSVHPLEGRTVYGRLGDWPGPVAGGVVAVWVARRMGRRASGRPGPASGPGPDEAPASADSSPT